MPSGSWDDGESGLGVFARTQFCCFCTTTPAGNRSSTKSIQAEADFEASIGNLDLRVELLEIHRIDQAARTGQEIPELERPRQVTSAVVGAVEAAF